MRVRRGVLGDPRHGATDAAQGDDRRASERRSRPGSAGPWGRSSVDERAPGQELDAGRRDQPSSRTSAYGVSATSSSSTCRAADRVDGLRGELRVVPSKTTRTSTGASGPPGTGWRRRRSRSAPRARCAGGPPSPGGPGGFRAGKAILPKKTSVVGCAANSKAVTIPKLPPPPRSAQNSSAFSSAVAGTTSPSAVTISARDQVVQRQAVLADLPADATGQASVRRRRRSWCRPTRSPGQCARAHRRPAPRWRRRRCARCGAPRRRPRRRQPAEVDDDPAVVGAEAREAVAAAAHGQRRACPRATGPPPARPDAAGPQDHGGTPGGQHGPAGRLVLRLVGFDDVAAEVATQRCQR